MPPLTLARSKRHTARCMLRHLWIAPIVVTVLLTMGGVLFFPGHAFAAAMAPGQPTSINGTAGKQQANLSWSQATGATGYFVNETDLQTGQTVQLSTLVTTTSTTVTGLQVGH